MSVSGAVSWATIGRVILAGLGVWIFIATWRVWMLFFVGLTTGLHPVAVLLAIVIGVNLAGVIGALVAVPAVAGLWEVFRELAAQPAGGREDVLGGSASDGGRGTSVPRGRAARRPERHRG